MRTTLLQGLMAFGLVAGGMAAAAPQAEAQSYPRTTGTAEDTAVDYGPLGQRTMVFGGGRVVVTMMDGANVTLMHLDSMFVQSPREGFVPVTVGTSEATETIYVPASMVDAIRRARALGTGH
jgi:hypothetical protein